MRKTILVLFICVLSIPLFSQELYIEQKKSFQLKNSYIVDARFSPFRNFFANLSLRNTLEIYDRNWNVVYNGQHGLRRTGPGRIAFSPDGRYLAVSKYSTNNDIALISLKDFRITQILRGKSFTINDLCFSNDGNLLAAAYDNEAIIWKLTGEKLEHKQEFTDFSDEITNIEFSFDDEYLIIADNGGFVSIYNQNNDSYKPFQKIKDSRAYIYGLDYHPRMNSFITGNTSGVKVYALEKNRFIAIDSIKEDLDIRHDFSYSPDGELISFTHYGWVKIFETFPKLKEVDGLVRNEKWSMGSRFSSDGKFLVTFSADSSLILWEISPVKPSTKYIISDWVNDKLTTAQRKILTSDNLNDIYVRVDKNMVSPRDEFETSESYEARVATLEDWTLSLIQKKTEEVYKIKPLGTNRVAIPIQQIIGYNADKQIYKIRFMETEAGVEIPIKEARKLKSNWERATISANKIKSGTGVSYSYSNFQIEIPGTPGSFGVTPLENPLNYTGTRSPTSVESRSESKESTAVADQVPLESGVITHALLFGTNVYDSFSELLNPVLDASTIAAELSENYGVNTEVVLNPTLTQTAEKLREYASRGYTENENLIVFFAGHGIYDEVFKEGYVISTDSRSDDISKTSYLSHSNLRTMINNIGCKSIFLVMDVCFGGTFDPKMAASAHRGVMEMYADISREEFIERKTKYKTRLYLTSGGKEYVPDGRSGFHSPFARRFIEALRKYGGEDGVLTTSEILAYVEKVDPQPRFGEFGDNEPGSDFILISK